LSAARAANDHARGSYADRQPAQFVRTGNAALFSDPIMPHILVIRLLSRNITSLVRFDSPYGAMQHELCSRGDALCYCGPVELGAAAA
jgi:hypothetical protein